MIEGNSVRLIAFVCSAACSPISFGGAPIKSELSVEPTKRLTFTIGVGAAYRKFGNLDFKTGWNSRASDVPQFFPSSSANASFGPRSGFANRSYNDGFVFRDINTANPNSFLPGTTAYFSYRNNSQIQNDNLVYRGSGSTALFSQSSQAEHSGWTDGDNSSPSPVLQAEALYPLTDSLNVGATLGFMFANILSAHTSSTFSARQGYQVYSDAVTDIYALDGLILPVAPYTGLFDPQGPAPLINNVPTSRAQSSTLLDSRSVAIQNRVRESLELNLYTISIGPTLKFDWYRLVASLSPGFGINIADWQANFDERLTAYPSSGGKRTLRHWQTEASGLKVLPGLYVQGAIGYQFTSFSTISAFGRYDWVKSFSEKFGPSSFAMELDGYTVGGMVIFNF